MITPRPITALSDQNGIPICPILSPNPNNGPTTAGPSVRARQPKDADAPLILAKWTGSGAVFVILECHLSTRKILTTAGLTK